MGREMPSNLSRRGLIGAIICAPAIVRASSLMPVKVWHKGGYAAYFAEMLDATMRAERDWRDWRSSADVTHFPSYKLMPEPAMTDWLSKAEAYFSLDPKFAFQRLDVSVTDCVPPHI